jgi:hypothetical protein
MSDIMINIYDLVGYFAENKDVGRQIRIERIMPALQEGGRVILNFEKVDRATQSFIHSLLSDPIRKFGEKALDMVLFKDCSGDVIKIVSFVTDYLQDAIQKGKPIE